MLRLRKAELADAHVLWVWANDAAARAASGNRPVIPWPEHLAWLESRLRTDTALVLVAETGDLRPVGTIRFETDDGWRHARLSYTIAPERRGRGHGRALLDQGVAALRRAHPEAVVEALVRPDNEPSLHLFRTLGWSLHETGDGPVRFTAASRVEDPCRF